MAGEGVDGIDLYADVDDFGPDAEYHDADIYEDMLTSRSGDSMDDVRLSNQILRQSSFNGKKFALYVANLTWWTTDNDLLEAITSVGVGDVLEIRFHENRVNGQSKGFATVVVSSESSSKILLEKLSKREIHGQHVVVTHCTTSAHKQFDTTSKKETVVPNGAEHHISPKGQRLRVPPPVGGGVITRPLQAPPSLAQLTAPPPANQLIHQQQQSLLGPATAVQNQARLLLPPGTNTALPPPALPQFQQQALRPFTGTIQTLQPANALGPHFQIVQGQPPHAGMQIIGAHHRMHATNPPPTIQLRGAPMVGLRLPSGQMEIREGFQQPPPNLMMRPPGGQMVIQQQQQHPPPVLANHMAPHGMMTLSHGHQQQQQQHQHMQHPQQQQHHHQGQPGSLAGPSLNPHVNPAFLATGSTAQQQQQHAVVTSVGQVAVDEYGRPLATFQAPSSNFPFPQPKSSSSSDRASSSYQSSMEGYRERDRERERERERERRTQASPQTRDRHDSTMANQVNDMEFEEILQKNKTVSSSAISRAVQDASVGEYASAIETLVTAISLIKQSRIASDDRCKILVCSLRDTLEGIESKSYGSKSSRDRRSRSPRERVEKHSTSSSSARHRSRSRDYRDSRTSRDKDRHHDSKSSYREGRSGRH